MSFTKKVLVGLFAGIFTGLFLGELASPFRFLATGFVKLLQMTVLPYVVISIISSLGSLSYTEARRLGVRVGAVIVVLWGVAVLYALLLPVCFPDVENASFFSTDMIETRQDFDFVDLYIPANPFHSLANNVVPAIVLFSVIMGAALIGVARKQPLLDLLRVSMETVSRATRFTVQLTPFGIFTIAAHAAGTLSMEQVERIQIYLISYIAIALLLALWVLPGLVSAVTSVRMRDLFAPNRDALVTAFVAGDLFIVLPALMQACEQILLRNGMGKTEEHKLPEVIVPASFNFPGTGKILSLSFILFAGWFSDALVNWRDYPKLIGAGILTIFGSLTAAIPFLLDLFRIPADTFQVFLATGVINSRFGTLVASMHLITVAILGSAAVAGQVRIRTGRVLRYLAVTAVLTAGVLGGLKFLFSNVLSSHFDGSKLIDNLKPVTGHPESVILKGKEALTPPAAPAQGVYEQILARKQLRVGYFANRVPFAFQNAEGKLVGFEVEAAHLLARDLSVEARFLPLSVAELHSAMSSGLCDIIMSGAFLTPRRDGETLFSQSYLDETLAFAVLDHRRQEFTTWDDIRELGQIRVAVPNLPHYLSQVRERLPKAQLVAYDPDTVRLSENDGFDAYVMAAEYGAIQTLLQSRFTIVVPAPSL